MSSPGERWSIWGPYRELTPGDGIWKETPDFSVVAYDGPNPVERIERLERALRSAKIVIEVAQILHPESQSLPVELRAIDEVLNEVA